MLNNYVTAKSAIVKATKEFAKAQQEELDIIIKKYKKYNLSRAITTSTFGFITNLQLNVKIGQTSLNFNIDMININIKNEEVTIEVLNVLSAIATDIQAMLKIF